MPFKASKITIFRDKINNNKDRIEKRTNEKNANDHNNNNWIVKIRFYSFSVCWLNQKQALILRTQSYGCSSTNKPKSFLVLFIHLNISKTIFNKAHYWAIFGIITIDRCCCCFSAIDACALIASLTFSVNIEINDHKCMEKGRNRGKEMPTKAY